MGTAKREARRQRAEMERDARERSQRQRQFRNRALFVAGLLGLLAVGALTVFRSDEAGAGRVWSPEHGHWHDK